MTSKSLTTSKLEYKLSKQRWHPEPHQIKGMEWMLGRACAGLFLDPSLGKTSISLAVIKLLKKKGLNERTLVIAPMRVAAQVWPAEAEKWLDFNGLVVEVAHGKDREEVLAGNADVVCVNPEGLSWVLGVEKTTRTNKRTGKEKTTVAIPPKRLRYLKTLGFTTLIVDESTRFKNPTALCSKLLKKMLGMFRRRYILTGTPVANHLMDLFGQIYIIDQGHALGEYITHFRSEYFYNDPYNRFDWMVLPGAEERIYKKIAPYILRMSSDDYLKLPELIENIIPVYLPAPAMKAYKEMHKDLVAVIKSREFTAMTAGVKVGKCAQIANGAIYYNDNENPLMIKRARKSTDYELVHSEKDDALVSLVSELSGQPLLVAYEFEHDYIRITKALKAHGVKFDRLGSGQSAAESKAVERAWNAGEIPVLLGHPRSIGHGLNLQGSCNNICWYSPTYDNELELQMNARIRRKGSGHSCVFAHKLVAQGTVDEVKIAATRMKEKGQQALFTALKEFYK